MTNTGDTTELPPSQLRDLNNRPVRRRTRASVPPLVLVVLVLAVQLLPPLPLYLGIATSMTLGATMAAGIIVLVYLLTGVLSQQNLQGRIYFIDVGKPLLVLLIAATVFLHAVIANMLQLIDLRRCVESLIPLLIVVGGGILLGVELRRSSERVVNSTVRISFSLLCIVMLMQLIGAQPRPAEFPKSMFPFTETSHFALAFLPVLLYLSVRAQGKRRLWWMLGAFTVALVLQSMSLLVGALLVAIACRLVRYLIVPILLVVLIGVPLDLSYYSSRLNFSGGVLNLSSLVYLQGWQLVQESLVRSAGWGIGFQQLGFHDTEAAAADLIRQITNGLDANTTDGSFVFAKIGSEFGVFGIVAGIAFLVLFARSLRCLRSNSERAAVTFARCIVVAYIVDMFVRGTGYFTQSTLLFISGMAALWPTQGVDLQMLRTRLSDDTQLRK
jgi:hypothetical protein